MQREVDGVTISLEPPQEKLVLGEKTHVLLTAYLRDSTPEELRERLGTLIKKRDALERISYEGIQTPIPFGKTSSYRGILRDFDEGIEYVYDIHTPEELNLARVVMDFDLI